jgi:ABC-type bacteriocin/lantibiotic exporter with double-glycine peptidase domain
MNRFKKQRVRGAKRIELENFKKFWGFTSKHDRSSIRNLTFLQVISSLLDLSILPFIMPMFSILNSGGDSSQIFAESWVKHIIGTGSADLLLVRFFSLMFFVYTVKSLAQIAIKVYSKRTKHRISASLTDRLFYSYLLRPFSWHNLKKPPVLVRDVNEASLLVEQQLTPIITILSETALVFVTISLLIFLQPAITLTAAVFVGITSFLMFKSVSIRIKTLGNLRLHHDAERASITSQSFFGIREVKVLGLENLLAREVASHTWNVTNANNSLVMIGEITPIVLEFLIIVTICILVFVGLFVGLEISYLLTILAFFSISAIRIVPSASRISAALQLLRYGSARVTDLINEIEIEQNFSAVDDRGERLSTDQTKIVVKGPALNLEGVSFKYDSSDIAVLKNVSMKIQAGEFVGITGTSGSGKSTLMDVCMGLLIPSTGTISILGLGKDEFNWSEIAYVSQQVFLFSETIWYNIWPGDVALNIAEEDVISVLDTAGLTEFVRSLPQGLETRIGDGGIKLSGGQRQRVGLARAIARKPKLLTLDEATSALDDFSEDRILTNLRALDLTVLMVSHSNVSLLRCDRVLLLDDGIITGDGDPQVVLDMYRGFESRP